MTKYGLISMQTSQNTIVHEMNIKPIHDKNSKFGNVFEKK